jgi:hypothetical protein
MIPFCCSSNGGSHVTLTLLDVTTTAVTLRGRPLGAVGTKVLRVMFVYRTHFTELAQSTTQRKYSRGRV